MPPTVDPGVKALRAVSGISGNLNSIGSDTLNNMMTFWAEGFKKVYPNVKHSGRGEGLGHRSAGPDAGHIAAGADVAENEAAGRRRFRSETRLQADADRRGRRLPGGLRPQGQSGSRLHPGQLDSIFSKTHKAGYADIATWGDVDLEGDWKALPISLYGRNSASGTYAYFKEHALKKGDYKDTVKEQPGSAAVVNGVANDRGESVTRASATRPRKSAPCRWRRAKRTRWSSRPSRTR